MMIGATSRDSLLVRRAEELPPPLPARAPEQLVGVRHRTIGSSIGQTILSAPFPPPRLLHRPDHFVFPSPRRSWWPTRTCRRPQTRSLLLESAAQLPARQ